MIWNKILESRMCIGFSKDPKSPCWHVGHAEEKLRDYLHQAISLDHDYAVGISKIGRHYF